MSMALTGIWQLIGKLVLVGVLMVSAVAVIYASHANRNVFNQLQQLLAQRDELEIEWGRLLLEQSALAAHSRVEQIAGKRLGMKVPDAEEIILVQ